MESKRQKFVRLAENRMNNALKNIELLGNLSNKAVYEYSQEDVDKILKALKAATATIEHSFKADKKSKHFTLK